MAAPSRRLVLPLLALLALPAGQAHAERSVYLNGVRIDGVTALTLNNAEVRIDSLGNVHIQAPGYQVKEVVQGTPKVASASLQRRYWLVSSKSRPGATRYEIEVFVNSRLVRKVRSPDPHLVLDVTPWIKPGGNVVHFKARKDLSLPKLSESPADFFKLLLGTGTRSGEQVVIDRTLVDYQRNAHETTAFDDESKFSAD